MKKYLVVVFGMCIFSCKAQTDGKVGSKELWVNSFKDYVFYKCLNEITDQKFQAALWQKKDVSQVVQAEVIGKYRSYADTLASNYVKKIEPLQVDQGSDLYGSKAYFDEVLRYYKSKSLDSLAKKLYAEYKDSIKED